MRACPSENDLAQFAEGRADEALRCSVEHHLRECVDCVEVVATFAPSRPEADVQLVAERFELHTSVGQGGMGEVFRGVDRLTGRAVAIKLVRGHSLERFLRESRLLATLDHPAIVEYISHGQLPSGDHFLVMEWLEGVGLDRHLKRTGPLPVDQVLVLARRVCEALVVMHARSVVHRDIKPSNLFLQAHDIGALKVLDFGIARQARSDELLTLTGQIVGTPAYMAPEQARGEKDVDGRLDLFSLGCVLFQALAGTPPFSAREYMAVLAKIVLEDPPRLRSMRPEVPPALDDLVFRLLAKDPEKRPPDAQEVLDELKLIHVTEGRSAGPSVPAASVTESERRFFSAVLVGAESGAGATAEEISSTRSIQGLVRSFGGRAQWLLDGSFVVSAVDSAGATDEAGRAARVALELSRRLPATVPLALATGRSNSEAGSLIGAVIDRAAALLPSAKDVSKGLRIAVDDVSAALLDARFELRRDGQKTYLVQMVKDLTPPRTLLGRPAPFVGRERELAALSASFAECVANRTVNATLVTARPGVGKSRLRHELSRKARADFPEARVWRSQGEVLRSGASLGLLKQVILDRVEAREREAASEQRAKLEDHVRRIVPAEARAHTFAFLQELVDIAPVDAELPAVQAARRNPGLLQEKVQEAVITFLAADCRRAGVLWIIDDLQWADLPTIKILDAALRDLDDVAFMVLAFARPEVHDTFPNLWQGRSIELVQLRDFPPRVAERFVREFLPDIGREQLDHLVERARGNAFYLEELIRAAAEGSAAIPESVLAMVESRLRALDSGARHVLRAASAFGETFWTEGLKALLGATLAASEIEPWLRILAERELIQRREPSRFPDTREYAFRHPLVRDAAYGMLTDTDRAAAHKLAAAWLEAQDETNAALIAEHFCLGQHTGPAASWFARAASHALRANDLGGCVRLAARAVDCGATGAELGHLQLLQAEAYLWMGDHDASQRCSWEAFCRLEVGSEPWAKAAAFVVTASMRAGSHHEHVVRAVEALRRADWGQELDDAIFQALGRAALYSCLGGQYRWSDELCARLEEPAERLAKRSPGARGVFRTAVRRRRLSTGDLESFVSLNGAAIADLEEAGEKLLALAARTDYPLGLMMMGQYEEAVRLGRLCVDEAERSGSAYSVPYAKRYLCLSLARVGRHDEASQVGRQAADAFAAQRNSRLEASARGYLAWALLEHVDTDGAERELAGARSALESVEPWMRHLGQAFVSALSASVCLLRHEDEAALQHAERAMAAVAVEGEVEEGDVLARVTYAEALLRAGRDADGRRALAAASERVMSVADRIADPLLRKSFLECVPENARTVMLATASTTS
jgi:hypothetical protein